MSLTYAVVTPARNEADALPRLADALARQTRVPSRWVIVENGSSDGTVAVAESIVARHAWAELHRLPLAGPRERGAPIVRALELGFDSFVDEPDVVANVDADVTFAPDYFERLLSEFERDPALGIASGSAWELTDGVWRQRYVTGGTVWGATRAYRWACLQQVRPLEPRHGWDGIDQLKARARGWETRTLTELRFDHHRAEGSLDGSRWAHWYSTVRPRTTWDIGPGTSSRGPPTTSDGIPLRSGSSAASRRRRCAVRRGSATRALESVLRDDQSLRNILQRRREALGRAAGRSGCDRAPTR